MAQKRDYPLFLIDRIRSESYPYDYIICLDKTYGFVAQVRRYDNIGLYDIAVENFTESGAWVYLEWYITNGISIEIIDMHINPTIEQQEKIKVLFKKAVKKYIVLYNTNN